MAIKNNIKLAILHIQIYSNYFLIFPPYFLSNQRKAKTWFNNLSFIPSSIFSSSHTKHICMCQSCGISLLQMQGKVAYNRLITGPSLPQSPLLLELLAPGFPLFYSNPNFSLQFSPYIGSLNLIVKFPSESFIAFLYHSMCSCVSIRHVWGIWSFRGMGSEFCHNP